MVITHAIPGRIRLRYPEPLAPPALEELIRKIKSIVPFAVLQYTPQTGSILILFGEKEKNTAILALFADADQATSHQARQPPKNVKTSHCQPLLRWPPMSWIKRGMIVSLLAALALLAQGREHGHGMMGTIFLGLLSRHLWVYRHRI
ncbi:MAG: hypothetical protein EYX74_00990 [Desulfobulbaceae bacterium]|nr:MAG: hypothetical protein EYX74_00990 [Desulfobulbaceae bacterium]